MSPVELVGALTLLHVQLSECHQPGHFAPNQWSSAAGHARTPRFLNQPGHNSYSGVREMPTCNGEIEVIATPASADIPTRLRADARRNIAMILDAAESCLARDPDASMSEIAAAAGLGRVTIYGHFSSRQVLVEVVVHRVLEAANAALNEVDLSGDPGEAFQRLVDATWQVTLRSGNLIIAADKSLPATTVRQAHAGGLEARVRNMFSAGQRSGAFRSDLSADWLMATFHAVLHAAANEIDAGRLERAEASRVITSTMLAALGYVPGSERVS
jgi:TetR/AcrR family transcriptional regulator, mexCD-oprJ operon repressor